MSLTEDVFGARSQPAAEIGERKPESQATAIVQLALEAGVELWHTPTGDPYITIAVGGHHEHHPLASHATRDYLGRLFYVDRGRAPNASARQDALATLSGIARFDGDQHDIHVRVAAGRDCILHDLGDPAWRVVEVTSAGWRVVTDPGVRFRRPRGMLQLPVPATGGSIEELRSFVNVGSKEDFYLLVMWTIQALRPRGPYPILIMIAEQGAAKTTTAKVLRRLCDPSASDVRRPPRNTEDLMIEATLDGDPVADVVRALDLPWSGTATELLAELNRRTPDAITKRKDWLSGPRQASDALRRLAPGLRKVGFNVSVKPRSAQRFGARLTERTQGERPLVSEGAEDRRGRPALTRGNSRPLG